MSKKIIPLYKERAFGEKVSATFDFLTGHIRLWLKCCLYLFLPLSLVQALALNSMFGSMTDLQAMENVDSTMDDYTGVLGFVFSYLGYIFFMAVGGLLMSAFIYAMIRYYRDNDNSLDGADCVSVCSWWGFSLSGACSLLLQPSPWCCQSCSLWLLLLRACLPHWSCLCVCSRTTIPHGEQ